MDRQLIETVTRLVMEKLKDAESGQTNTVTESKSQQEKRHYGSVKVWNHVGEAQAPKSVEASVVSESSVSQAVPIVKQAAQQIKTEDAASKKPGISKPKNKEQLAELMKQTPARIGIGRAGLRPKTDAWLSFRFDHAAAVDAVYGTVSEDVLKRLNLFSVVTRVDNKQEYILRPDLGRRLSDEAKRTLKERCKHKPKVQIVVSDGLSSQAVEANVEDTYLALKQSLTALGIEMGTPFFVERGALQSWMTSAKCWSRKSLYCLSARDQGWSVPNPSAHIYATSRDTVLWKPSVWLSRTFIQGVSRRWKQGRTWAMLSRKSSGMKQAAFRLYARNNSEGGLGSGTSAD